MTPLVSVLIPCFNAAAYVAETLESVQRQTWPNLEIVVVDDGSTDGSRAELERFGDRVRLISQQNRGQTAALNVALSAAHGDFIQYLDADDLILPDKIERQMRRLIMHPRAVASAEWARFRRSPDEAVFAPESVWRDMAPLDWLIESRRDGRGMMFPALWLIPRSVTEAAGPWREDLTLNNDAEYFTRVLLESEAVLFCRGARCFYRSSLSGNLSGRKTQAAWRSQYAVLDACERRVLSQDCGNSARRAFSLSWQEFAHAAYPYDAALAEQALYRAKSLDPVRSHPGGGLRFKVLSRLIGWRAARVLQVASGRP